MKINYNYRNMKLTEPKKTMYTYYITFTCITSKNILYRVFTPIPFSNSIIYIYKFII